MLLPDPTGGQWNYEERSTVDRYLWSHYGDLAGVTTNAAAYATWISYLNRHTRASFEAGCAVGRLTFEMAARSDLAVGCDLSVNFIRTARNLAQERECCFSLPLEGNLREQFRFVHPEHWRTDNLEFIVADVLALPFAKDLFSQIATLNIIDRVRSPLAHLYEMNRISQPEKASFIFADPFSWSTSNTPEEFWLGGTEHGPYAGRGIDNVRALLQGKNNVMTPPWKIIHEGLSQWQLRSHCNHQEIITSQLLLATR